MSDAPSPSAAPVAVAPAPIAPAPLAPMRIPVQYVPQPRPALPPTTFIRYWPGPGAASAPRIALSLIVVAAVVAAVSLVLNTPGFGWLLTALAMAAVAVFTGLAKKPSAAVKTMDGQPQPEASEVAATTDGEPATTDGEPADNANKAATEQDVASANVAEAEAEAEAEPEAEAEATPSRRFSVRVHAERVFWGLCALALVSVGTFRAAGWLFFWCVVFAFGCSALAMAGGRTVKGMFFSVLTLPSAVVRSPGWVVRGLAAMRSRNGGPRIVISVAISVLLLVVFGGLFAGADAEFAHVLGSIMPPLQAPEVARAIFCFIIAAGLACGVAFLASARTQLDYLPPSKPRTVRRIEWVMPLALLNVLFAVFVFIQLTVLFGHDPKLLNASKAAMKGYAHSGFWQLLVVTILTLTVLGISGRVAPRETRSDRTLLRVLLGGLTVFSIVVVLSALKRVYAYENAYGFTRLRVVVAGVEVWFGVLFVLVLIAGIGLKASWLPRVVAASLALSLLTGAIVNPDRYVAQQNVHRYEKTGKLSIYYMRQMSADAVPAIDQLPDTLRACSLVDIANALADRADDWRTWNFARVDARNDIGHLTYPANCPDLVE